MICNPPSAGIRSLAGLVVGAFQEGRVKIIASPFWFPGTLLLSSRVTQPLTAAVNVMPPLIKHIPSFFVTVRVPSDTTLPEKLVFGELSFEEKKAVAAQFIRRIEVAEDSAEIIWAV